MADVTLEEVWRLFKETDAKFKETDAKFKETDAKFKETDLNILGLAASNQKLKQVLEKAAQEREESWRRVDAAMADLSRKMGRISNRLGDFAEEMVVPAVGHLFQARGLPVHQVSRRTYASYDGHATDFDILVVNADHVMAVEVKSQPSVQDVDEHIERLVNFKRYLPRYGDCKVMGAIAGLTVDEGVARYAYRQGLFVLGQSGETVVILNDDKFRPKVW